MSGLRETADRRWGHGTPVFALASDTATWWRTARKRCRAVLLAVLFLGGQYGPPLVDMLVSHNGGSAQAHVEQHQEKTCHAEHCMLGYVAPTANLAVVTPALARLAMPRAVRGVVASRARVAQPYSVALPLTRAPPPASA